MARRLTLEFLKTEAGSGMLLGLAAVAALIVANSPLAPDYFAWLKSEHVLQLGPLRLEESVSNWIKEGLMSIFFLVVGLEIKHEILRGELSDPRKLATPIVAAAGGIVAPALIYLVVAGVLGGPHQGWPVPLATDIAFALAVFAMVARGLPTSLRLFLLTLAIVDDLAAIALIAVLFSQGVDWMLVGMAALAIGVMSLLSLRKLAAPFWVLGFGVVWWLAVESGLSTSLAGVAFAAIVPIRPRVEDDQSPLREAMHDLHPYVAYLVLPLFAFAKAGVSFQGLALSALVSPLVLGVALGLFVGKQVGVFGASWLAERAGLAKRPGEATLLEMYGVCLLCGVGFTMALFIGGLAFPGAVGGPEQTQVTLGVLLGSLLSALAGAAVLGFAARRRNQKILTEG